MKMVKKIFLSCLITILSISLISCGKEPEKLTLFPGNYLVKTVIYNYYLTEYIPPLEVVTISKVNDEYSLTESSGLEIKGKLQEFELTKDNFDNLFREDTENFSWQNHENKISDLRKSNNGAWYVEGSNRRCYFLLQNDASKYIVYLTSKGQIANIYHLE